MRYWDSSGLLPLLVQEAQSAQRMKQLRAEMRIVTWWGSKVECASALNRLNREGRFDAMGLGEALDALQELAETWVEIQPSERLQEKALRLLRIHPLRAGDALQLAAALVACDDRPARLPMVCADERLCAAARREGFPLFV